MFSHQFKAYLLRKNYKKDETKNNFSSTSNCLGRGYLNDNQPPRVRKKNERQFRYFLKAYFLPHLPYLGSFLKRPLLPSILLPMQWRHNEKRPSLPYPLPTIFYYRRSKFLPVSGNNNKNKKVFLPSSSLLQKVG